MNGKCYFFFPGYHTVMTASELLTKNGVSNRVVKAPISYRNSCNFAVLTDIADVKYSSFIFSRENMFVEKRIMKPV